MADPDGVILYDKPAGVTSHDVVARVRRERGRVRTGHAGTLDPFATGLLLVLVGRATRMQRFLMALPKTYRVVARFGARSSTGDPDGEVVETGTSPPARLALPTGTLRQRPPAYSAVHVDGERAYARARRGERVELPEREVQVHAFRELGRRGRDVELEVVCSAGTYVRSLVADLGEAYCLALRRTRIGPFAVERADPAHVVGLDEALGFLPRVELDPDTARRAGHGVAVPAPSAPLAPVVRLADADGLVAVAERRPAREGPGDELKPVVGLRG